LAAYVERFTLPVRLDARVTGLVRTERGFGVSVTGSKDLAARRVIVATGPFPVPYVPDIATGMAADVPQLHTSRYRRPEQVGPGAGADRRWRQLRLPGHR
jgi:putative flavoprotein involved in K+ transport